MGEPISLSICFQVRVSVGIRFRVRVRIRISVGFRVRLDLDNTRVVKWIERGGHRRDQIFQGWQLQAAIGGQKWQNRLMSVRS